MNGMVHLMFFHLFPTASRYKSLLGDAELRCLSAFKAGPAAIPFGTQLQVYKMLSFFFFLFFICGEYCHTLK